MARLLVENGADVFLRGDDGCLPIHLAVKYRPDVFAETVGQKESISDDDLENLQEDIIFFIRLNNMSLYTGQIKKSRKGVVWWRTKDSLSNVSQ